MGARVLVVEDDRAQRIAMARLLTAEGYEVQCAFDGEAAIRDLERARYDAMLLDLNLGPPGTITGFDVAAHVSRRCASMPIIVVTGADDASHLDEWAILNPLRSAVVVVKPIDVKLLLRQLAIAVKGAPKR
jgi:two-component system, repressor protein LuxO